jgi:hypothetical protein
MTNFKIPARFAMIFPRQTSSPDSIFQLKFSKNFKARRKRGADFAAPSLENRRPQPKVTEALGACKPRKLANLKRRKNWRRGLIFLF